MSVSSAQMRGYGPRQSLRLTNSLQVGGAPSDIGDFFVLNGTDAGGKLLRLQYGKTGNLYAPAASANLINFQTLINAGASGLDRQYAGISVESRLQAGMNGTALGAQFYGVAELASTQSGARGGATGIFTVGSSTVGGDVFGGNPYAKAQTVAARQVVGQEVDTDNRVNGTGAKKGLQIVDVATSTGTVTAANNIGLHLLAQTGAYGYDFGFAVGDPAGQFPIRSTGTLFKSSTGTLASGFDLTNITFTGNARWALTLNGMKLASYNAAGLALQDLIWLDSSDVINIYNTAFRINSLGSIVSNIGLYGVAPVARAAAIASPTAPSAGYVQAEAQSMKTAVDAIRVAIANIGLTL